MSEEEKTLEEQTETIIDEIEAENDVIIEPETEDDVREVFEINKEDGPRESLGAPLIKAAGDPEPADMTMIHKHLDNFLAKIAGETPIDENVRDSTEYWLKRLADGEGGSTKKIYWHNVRIKRDYIGSNPSVIDGMIVVLNNSPDPFTLDDFDTMIKTPGVIFPVIGGFMTSSSSSSPWIVMRIGYAPSGYFTLERCSIPDQNVVYTEVATYLKDNWTVTDIGTNTIN